ncbi:MAG: hypothetical protein MJZ41_07705 [Bacteroidaceae bacterium]|nr:hypothetical protein [Bacteroidaceae bacterium]
MNRKKIKMLGKIFAFLEMAFVLLSFILLIVNCFGNVSQIVCIGWLVLFVLSTTNLLVIYMLIEIYEQKVKSAKMFMEDFIRDIKQMHTQAKEDAYGYPSESNRTRRDTLYRVLTALEKHNSN